MGRSSSAVRLVNGRTPEQWAEIIRGKWQENVKSIFETALYLETAREELGPAFWAMVRDELKWSKGTASKLLTIASDDKLAGVSHAKLPASWDTLYNLACLTPDQFETGIESGIIHAGMERKDIAQLKPPKPKPDKPAPTAAPKKKPQSLLPRKESLINEAFLLISTDLYEMPLEDQEDVLSELRLMIDQLEETVKFNREKQGAAS
jgi:hypothetical protein